MKKNGSNSNNQNSSSQLESANPKKPIDPTSANQKKVDPSELGKGAKPLDKNDPLTLKKLVEQENEQISKKIQALEDLKNKVTDNVKSVNFFQKEIDLQRFTQQMMEDPTNVATSVLNESLGLKNKQYLLIPGKNLAQPSVIYRLKGDLLLLEGKEAEKFIQKGLQVFKNTEHLQKFNMNSNAHQGQLYSRLQHTFEQTQKELLEQIQSNVKPSQPSVIRKSGEDILSQIFKPSELSRIDKILASIQVFPEDERLNICVKVINTSLNDGSREKVKNDLAVALRCLEE